MKVYSLTMTKSEIAWVDSKRVYFRPDIVFDINVMSFVPNTAGSLFAGIEFTKGLYAIELVRLGDALTPKCNTVESRIDLDVVQLGLK